MINWPAASGIDTLTYSNGVFTNNTNAVRVYDVNFQTFANAGGAALSEADVWITVNTGSDPVAGGGFQRRGQQAFVSSSGGTVASTFLSSSSTITLQPGGTFGVAYYAATSVVGGTYVLGGASGASFPSGQSTRLSVKEVTNIPAQYQGGVLQNTEDLTAYVANTNTLLTFQTEVLDTNDSLLPDTVNGVRVWKNSSTYARSYIFDYTANIATTSNVGLATIWLQRNSTSVSATGRFAMTTAVNLNAPAAVISNTAAITLQPGEYVTAWFLCDQSGNISAGNFGFAEGAGTRITITEVSSVPEGFNQFPTNYVGAYSSNGVDQSVPALTTVSVLTGNTVFADSVNADLLGMTPNTNGSWSCTQSGLYTLSTVVAINTLANPTVALLNWQVGNTVVAVTASIPAGVQPFYLTTTGNLYVQAGNTLNLRLRCFAAVTITSATALISKVA
jgi:hypothetical protein